MRAPLLASGGARAVVLQLVDEAFVEDKTALRVLCDSIMSSVNI
jgi:hypothetical protein